MFRQKLTLKSFENLSAAIFSSYIPPYLEIVEWWHENQSTGGQGRGWAQELDCEGGAEAVAPDDDIAHPRLQAPGGHRGHVLQRPGHGVRFQTRHGVPKAPVIKCHNIESDLPAIKSQNWPPQFEIWVKWAVGYVALACMIIVSAPANPIPTLDLGLGPDLNWTGLDWGLGNWTRAWQFVS